MKRIFVFLLALFVISCNRNQQPISDLEKEILNNLLKINLSLPSIWPGYDLKSNTAGICFGEKCIVFSKDIKFQNQITLGNSNNKEFLGCISNPLIPTKEQDIVKISGKDVFLKNYFSSYHFLPHFIHEDFHFYEMKNFKMPEINSIYTDENLTNFVSDKSFALIILENTILSRALVEPEKVSEYIKDFITVRKYRYSFERKEIIEWEKAVERLEGGAEYVAYKSAEKIGLENYETLSLSMLLNDKIDGWSSRGRFYGSATAQLILLDIMQVDWKKRLEMGASPFEILSESFRNEKIKVDLKEIFRKYDFDFIQEEAKILNQKNKKIYEDLQKLIKDKEKISIKIEDLKIVLWGIGQKNPISSISDLEVNDEFHNDFCDMKFSGAMLYIPQVNIHFMPTKNFRVILKDKNIEIKINKEQDYNQGKKNFDLLYIKANTFEFNLRKKGIIERKGNLISIKVL